MHEPPRSYWLRKFRVALGGLLWAMRTEVNFRIHLPLAVAVVAAAAWLGASPIEWCVLVLCVTIVLAAETFNTALEHLARAITRETNEQVRRALDAAAGAVLVASIGAALTGSIIFATRLAQWLGW